MSEIVELKQTLNTIVPRIFDMGHTPLTLNEDASDAAFLRTYSRSIEDTQRFLAGAGADLRALAGDKANLLSAVQVTGEMDEATIAAITMLQAAAVADTSGQVGAGLKQTISMLNDLATKTQALPEEMRRNVNAESRRLLTQRGTAAPAPKTPAQQAAELMQLSDSYLGVTGNPSTNTDVLESTGRALKDYLKQQRDANPDICVDFVPQHLDVRAAHFMNELLQKRMREAGVQQEDLQKTLNQIWLMQMRGEQPSSPAMRELGRVGAMKSLVDYIVGARLPGGAYTDAPPRTDTPWENPVRDRFFNQAVYVDLLNGDSVSAKSLLHPDNSDPTQQALIRSIAERLGFDLNAQSFTRDQVGQIATEIMAHQARVLCIDEHDISKAMLEGRFNPHQDDVFLAKIGFGKPPRDQGRAEQLERIGITREQQHDIYFRAQFDEYRDQRWVERFGAVDDEHLFRLAQRLRPDLVPQNMDLKYDDVKDSATVQMIMRDLRDKSASAASLFEWGGRSMVDPYNFRETYNRLREDRYLPTLRERVNEGGLDLCSDAQPSHAGGDGVCYADDIDGPCGTETHTGGDDGVCYADDFQGACGGGEKPGDDESIRRNAGDATGQKVEEDGACYADDMDGPCHKEPAAAPVH